MLIWTQIVSEDGKLPHYKCLHCDRKIYEHHKTTMLKNGKWVAKYPDRPIAGFHLSSLYSPVGWFSWKQAMINYEQAKGNDALLKVWVNTTLGESWQDKGETPAWEHLYERAEDYPIGKIPEGGLVLTAGVDVQKDRLECEVVAWGPHRESWSVDYIVIPHAPSQQESWQQLETILHKNYPFVSDDSKGQQIMMMAIDSGYAAQEVYNWVRSQNSLRVMATKGSPHPRVPLGSPTKVEVNIGGRKLKRGLKLWCIGVNLLKSELYSWLKQTRVSEKVPPGYAHFPKYGPEYFMQLTAEQLVTKVVNGYPKQEWQKLRDRNEVLDCRVYARAASIALGIDRWEARHWKNFSNQKQVNIAAVEAPVIYQNPVDFIKTPTNTPTPEPVVANKANRPRPRVIRSKWMS
jgi:phage terminase large subunit GpA-like protein